MIEVEIHTGINGSLRIFVLGNVVLHDTLRSPNIDQYREVEYQRGADPQFAEFGSIKSTGRTLARISYICMQNDLLFDFSSVTKKRFAPDGSGGICMELPLSDVTMEALFMVIKEELEELSKSALGEKERNGFC
jgi:hypothetical protein